MLEAVDSIIPFRSPPLQPRVESGVEFQRLWVQSGLEAVAPVDPAPQPALASDSVEEHPETSVEEPFFDQWTIPESGVDLASTPLVPNFGDGRDTSPDAGEIAAAFFGLKLQPIKAQSAISEGTPASTKLAPTLPVLTEALNATHDSRSPALSAELRLQSENAPLATAIAPTESGLHGEVLAIPPPSATADLLPDPFTPDVIPHPHPDQVSVGIVIPAPHPASKAMSSDSLDLTIRTGDKAARSTLDKAPRGAPQGARPIPPVTGAGDSPEPSKLGATFLGGEQDAVSERALSPAAIFSPPRTDGGESGSIGRAAEEILDQPLNGRFETRKVLLPHTAQAQTLAPAAPVAAGAAVAKPSAMAELNTQPLSANPPQANAEPATVIQALQGVDTAPTAQPVLQLLQPVPHPKSVPRSAQTSRTEISNQIITAVVDRSSGTIELALQPDELGHLRIQLRPEGEVTRVVLHANREETLEFLRRHASDLEQDLGSSGFSNPQFSFEHDPSPPDDMVAEPSPLGPLAPTPLQISNLGQGGKRLDLRL